jgi:hypothetical protein
LASEPFLTLLDGSVYTPDIYPYYGQYRFFLPKGSHTVQVFVQQAPGTPTNVMVSAVNNGQATVSFTAPLNDGLSPITSYTVTANPGNITATSSSRPFSPITVSGLNNSTVYTFTDQANNAVGTGPAAPATTNLYGLSVNINGTGSGSVNISPSGINCTNGTYSFNFISGSTFSLLPSASSGSQFMNWGGACTGIGTCNVSVNAIYQSVTATFNSLTGARILATLQPYSLIQSAYNGAITGDVIQAQGATFVENIALSLPTAVTLMGGFDPTFSTQNSYTILQGSLTIEQGSLVVDHLTIE